MTYRLTATISHKSFDAPVTKIVYYQGESLNQILQEMRGQNVPEHHLKNLEKHMRAAFKDARGVKHAWKLEQMPGLN